MRGDFRKSAHLTWNDPTMFTFTTLVLVCNIIQITIIKSIKFLKINNKITSKKGEPAI